MIVPSRLVAASLAGLVLAAPAAAPAAARSGRPASSSDRTSVAEARRVDRVPAPDLNWKACLDYAECTTARLPLDYDNPHGATTELGLLRVPARDPSHRVGSLFVNPGGPGGSSTALAYAAPYFLSDAVLDRFDIVGVDPRGVGFSENLRCFASPEEQATAYSGLWVPFPYTRAEERAFVSSSRALGRGCSTTGKRLAGAMSTAEVARDMEVLRRSVGDTKLNYLGFSYGSVLGQYYANMFPDRVRAVAIDGVVDPTRWVGSRLAPETATFDRIRSADATTAALHEILVRCEAAGTARCTFGNGAAERRFATLTQRLKAEPAVIPDPEAGEVVITYATFISTIRSLLYSPDGYRQVIALATVVDTATAPPGAASPTARKNARNAAAASLSRIRGSRSEPEAPYENGLETVAGVTCTDSLNPFDAGEFPALGARADRRAPYFGRPWAWLSAWCARDTWTVHDEDAYRGPFTRRTASPVLVVGNYWDPATNYSGATAAARLLPNSRLLSSDSWGHTAYGTSACATSAVDNYLITGVPPAEGTVCKGDVQPFAAGLRAGARTARPSTDINELAGRDRPAAGTPKQLPPVVAPAGTTDPALVR